MLETPGDSVEWPVDKEDGVPLEDESAIIERVLHGERELFRHLVTRYHLMIFALINRQIGNRDITEEIAQEVFIRAFTKLGKFRGEAKFSTWLTRIALNQTSTWFTSREGRAMKRTDSFDPQLHQQSSDGVSDHEKKERLLQFRRCLSQLKPKYRDVLVLCGLEERSYEEAAEVLCIPIGTVRSRLNKARLILKEAMVKIA